MSLSNILVPNAYNLDSNSLTLNESAANPGAVNTLWIDSANGNLMFGAEDLSAGSGTVTSISAGTGITCTPDPIVATGTISISDTTVTSGTYSPGLYTVNARGQLVGAISYDRSVVNGTGPITLTNAEQVLAPYTVALLASTNMNLATGVYTCAVTGVYQISLFSDIVTSTNAAELISFYIRVNGGGGQALVSLLQDTSGGSQQLFYSGFGYISAMAGDLITLTVEDSANAGTVSTFQMGVLQVQ